ncbi:type I secretion system ATPase [Liberibacter crescens BT-1]|uniref:Type I secretion system ATPase n=1 Tax=Liberibacter crescens (strain BT-1) TaxID=1215343 RepID=L0EU34_LIBCB|nr:ATP-binding cassette domain-containing protein [Liberibacter crescens]AGA64365.1 type I secretion system ATPase [Liberibacter crescens BT-1]AMC12558.1 ATPase [Liberibacter crescens]
MSYMKYISEINKLSSSRFLIIMLPSFFINIFYLISPIYMMHIYDSVIGTQSEINLVAISTIALFFYILFFSFDLIRSRMLIEVSRFLEQSFKSYIHTVLKKYDPTEQTFASTANALDKFKQFVTSPIIPALFDLPFTPIFIILSFAIHPVLGLLTIISAVILITITLFFSFHNENLARKFEVAKHTEIGFGQAILKQKEYICTLSNRDFLLTQWETKRRLAQENQLHVSKISTFGSVFTKTLRMILQSAVLGLGAWLVLRQSLSSGSIIAASIVTSRALAPLEQIVNARQVLRNGWKSLETLIKLRSDIKIDSSYTKKKNPEELLPNNKITVRNLTLHYTNTPRPIFQDLSFFLPEATCCIITGPNGSGKTSLLHCMLGLTTSKSGGISFGNIPVTLNTIERFSSSIGYLSQTCTLFPISIVENIAMSNDIDSFEIAKKAAIFVGCHDTICSLNDGYATNPISQRMSPGLIQQICLARTICRHPKIVLMDEPLRNLDSTAMQDFYTTIKKLKEHGTTVIIVSRDTRIINMSDLLLMFHPSAGPLFGPTHEVIKKLQAIPSN